MKIYAKTLSPESSWSTPYLDCCDGRIETGGNSLISHIKSLYGAATDEYIAANYGGSFADCLNSEAPRKDSGEPYSEAEAEAVAKAMRSGEPMFICTLLSAMRGEPYTTSVMRGCSQYEFERAYYPESLDPKELELYKSAYFGYGTEIIIHDGDGIPESPNEVSGYGIWSLAYDADGFKSDIAEATGASPNDVVLWVWKSHRMVDVYSDPK